MRIYLRVNYILFEKNPSNKTADMEVNEPPNPASAFISKNAAYFPKKFKIISQSYFPFKKKSCIHFPRQKSRSSQKWSRPPKIRCNSATNLGCLASNRMFHLAIIFSSKMPLFWCTSCDTNFLNLSSLNSPQQAYIAFLISIGMLKNILEKL